MHPTLVEIGPSRSTRTGCSLPSPTSRGCSWRSGGRANAASTARGCSTSGSTSLSVPWLAPSSCSSSSTSTTSGGTGRPVLDCPFRWRVLRRPHPCRGRGVLVHAPAPDAPLGHLRRLCPGDRPWARDRALRVPDGGCCYGRPTTLPWGITFTDPFAGRELGTPLGVPLHPTQLYEAGAELVILVFLLAFERKGRPFRAARSGATCCSTACPVS